MPTWTGGLRGSGRDVAKGRFVRQGKRDVNKALQIIGTEELKKNVELLAGAVRGEKILDVLMGGAMIMRNGARARAPVATGLLKSAIFAGRGDQRGRPYPSVLVGINHKRAPHWHFFEYGTVKQSARPYFRPGVIASTGMASARITAGVKDLIRKATP